MRFKQALAAGLHVFVSLLLAPAPANATLVVNSWNLECFVRDGRGGIDVARITTLQTPLSTSHQGAFQPSLAFGSYQAAFDSQTFDFRIDTSLTAAGNGNNPLLLRSTCTASILITAVSDLRLSVDSSVSYNLAGGDREAILTVSAAGAPGPPYFQGGGAAAPVFGDPPVGVFTAHGDAILLPAGAMYAIGYDVTLLSITGSPSALSHMDGYVEFHLVAVPEPNSLALMILAALTMRRRFSLNRPRTSR